MHGMRYNLRKKFASFGPGISIPSTRSTQAHMRSESSLVRLHEKLFLKKGINRPPQNSATSLLLQQSQPLSMKTNKLLLT